MGHARLKAAAAWSVYRACKVAATSRGKQLAGLLDLAAFDSTFSTTGYLNGRAVAVYP